MNIGYLEVASDGAILSKGFCAAEVLYLVPALNGGTIHQYTAEELKDVEPTSHYAPAGSITMRATLPVTVSKTSIVADDVDSAVITGLPLPCVVRVDGQANDVDDGEIEITSAMPATYVLEVNHWPYHPWRVEITANAP